jgi:hypothetical protein
VEVFDVSQLLRENQAEFATVHYVSGLVNRESLRLLEAHAEARRNDSRRGVNNNS